MIRTLFRKHKQRKACQKLQKLVEARRNSFPVQDFIKRRNAMLAHTRRAG